MNRGERQTRSRIAECGLRIADWRWTGSRCSLLAPRSLPRQRRGVLLLVVLSMLVLFMLIGTAFLMSSNQYRTAATGSAKADRVGTPPDDLVDRALMQVLRDTNNPYSVVHYHSLLRDLYGTDGFEAVVYSPASGVAFNPSVPATQVTRFAGAIAGTSAEQFGPTQGQFIDIYVKVLTFGRDDPATTGAGNNESQLAEPDARHGIELERNANGVRQAHTFPLTKGYYNGCLLTVTSGPAHGQSTRIVDYQWIANLSVSGTSNPIVNTRLFRFRVLAFPRADGLPLQVSQSAARSPELTDLAGATLVVNGRAYNGTGVGYNPLSSVGSPRLSALQRLDLSGGNYLGAEVALLPNSRYFDWTSVSHFRLPQDPFSNFTPGTYFTSLNDDTAIRYSSFVGGGDADESYDAADFQNVFLALQSVTPRAQGRVVTSEGTYDVDDQRSRGPILRLDLEDLPLPSFHRPALVNFWYHRMFNSVWLRNAIPNPNRRVRAILGDPTLTSAEVSPQVAGQIAAVKRKIILRPLREDNPNFDGSNPKSRPVDLSDVQLNPRSSDIPIPYWEVVGPWDVDNDNDGVPDSIWVDLGDPVEAAEDGTRYKPLYAFLIVDLDSRLNVNAHGLVEHIKPVNRDGVVQPAFDSDYVALAGQAPPSASRLSSDQLPEGLGYGPAEISLRPILSPTLPTIDPASVGQPLVDDYARLLVGRPGTGLSGRDGSVDAWSGMPRNVQPGITYKRNFPALTVDPLAELKFFDFPNQLSDYYDPNPFDVIPFVSYPTAYGSPPDLMGRYSLGLDYTGQPVYEAAADILRYGNGLLRLDAPYEMNLSAPVRRDVPDPSTVTEIARLASSGAPVPYNDDAPFATADLERVLRAYDADAGMLASRLWDVVDAFDPLKLLYQPGMTPTSGDPTNPAPLELANAQQTSAVNRRLVTTDSYDLPVPNDEIATKLAYGADGQPGVAGQDDNFNGTIDEPEERNSTGSDDYGIVMGTGSTATPPPEPPARGRLLDYLRYRIVLQLKREQLIRATTPATDAVVETAVNAIIHGGVWADQQSPSRQHVESGGLLAPEVIAGQRMDLNRPLGDGRDNAGDGIDNNNNGLIDEPSEAGDPFVNGIVDEPSEAGEPFLDVDGNGKWNGSEPFIDEDGNGQYTPPRDQLWQGLVAEPIGFDYTNGHGEPIHPAVAGGFPATARVRNLSSQARQLYARQLYCLMLLLVDEGYVETQNVMGNDEGNINLLFFAYDIAARKGHTNGPTPEDTALALRKLTARRIAQWAVNCVDFRDADAIMTPFEYDENPWDGWGTLDRNGSVIPLDGDVATNENGSETMPEIPPPSMPRPRLADDNMAQVIDWSSVATSRQRDVSTNLVTGPTSIENQTRGVVWGVERPELLMTETLAFHDRRCTDEGGPGSIPTNASIFDPPSPGTPPDFDLDQHLKPRGSMFVELYNPWSPDGEKPAELYGTTSAANGQQGVMLNRLSDVPVKVSGVDKYSPVWRLAVLRDPIGGRLTDQSLQLLQVDPDGFGVDMDQDAERWIYFNTGGDPNRDDDNYIATSGGTADYELVGNRLVPQMDNLKVWVAPRPYRIARNPQTNQDEPYATASRYFIARTERVRSVAARNDTDVPIAPILPGRYALVGSSGLQLTGTGISGNFTPPTGDGQTTTRFVTSLGRLPGTSSDEQTDRLHRQMLGQTRRIELWPSPDPDGQQLLIGANGGQEFARFGATYVNVTDSDLDGVPDSAVAAPCVAIPVEDMNVSEPTEGYPSLLYQQQYYDENQQPLNIVQPRLNAEGELEYDPAYDRPLDMDFDLVRNGTTQKYRTLHLQRLANPTLPWNPLPFDANGNPNPLHQPNLPVNPYRTIDSMSVDLTANNGASPFERNMLPTTEAQNLLGISRQDVTQDDFVAPLSVAELGAAPDHVLWAIVYVLKQAGIGVPADARTPAGFRKMIETQPDTVEGYLSQLENKKGGNPTARAKLLEDRSYADPTTGAIRRWDGEWGWHLFRRVLPEDYLIPGYAAAPADFRQRLNMKSLERGGHYLGYRSANQKWELDPEWVPRLLWKQERPDFMLLGATARVSDLKSVRSRRVLRGDNVLASDYRTTDDDTRSQFYRSNGMFDSTNEHVFDYVLEGTLGFANEAYAPELDRTDGDAVAMLTTQKLGAPEIVSAAVVDTPELNELKQWNPSEANRLNYTEAQEQARRKQLVQSTYPWLAWNDRPFVSADEILQVPASSSSLMLRDYSVVNSQTPNPYDGSVVDDGAATPTGTTTTDRAARQQAPFGHLLNFFMAWAVPATATIAPDTADVDGDGNTTELIITMSGAPNYSRILDYVEVPSRYVGTDTLLSPEVFNDDPTVSNASDDITGPDDPRYAFQPPFNTVSRQRDPGRVNLNTVVGQREETSPAVGPPGIPHIWSEVYDGIMHRYQDENPATQLGQFGPAWRDVTLSRRGYAQFNAIGPPPPTSVDKPGAYPDTFTFGLNPNFPTFFANPFRSPDAGDLVPLQDMLQTGVQASWLRSHPYGQGDDDGWGVGNQPGVDDDMDGFIDEPYEGDDNGDGLVNDVREAGFGDDELVKSDQSPIPLFSEEAMAPSIDAERNPYMMYQPMTRLGNLVTTRSGVFAIWITVGYFEVEPAPNWNLPAVRERFGGDPNDADPSAAANVAARALYDRVYPEGYALGQEMGRDTGNVKRQRAFFIVDRTQPVGFQPGEDLNVEDMIRVRRRIE